MSLETLLLIVLIITIGLCLLSFSVKTTSTKTFTLSPTDESRFIDIETKTQPGRFTPTIDKNHMVVKSLTQFGISPLISGVIWRSVAPLTDTASPVIESSTRTFNVFNTQVWERNRRCLLMGSKGVDQRTMAVSLPIKDPSRLFEQRESVKVSYNIELILSVYDRENDIYGHISQGVYIGFSTGEGDSIVHVVRPSFLLSGTTIFSGEFDFVPTDCDIDAKHNCVVVDPVISVQVGNAPDIPIAVTILRAHLKLE